MTQPRLLMLSALICLTLSACSHPTPVLVTPEPLPAVPTVIKQPRPAPIEVRPVVFGSATIAGVPVLTLDAQNYENLRLNLADTGRWIKEALARLDYYDNAAENPAQ